MSSIPSMDQATHDASIRLKNAELVHALRDILGARLVAFLGDVRETRAVRQWADGVRKPSEDVLRRLRFALRVADLIQKCESAAIAQAWFTGLNPALDDQSPATLIRDGELDIVGPKVLAAAKALIGGV